MARPDARDGPRAVTQPPGDRTVKNTAAERALGITITDSAGSGRYVRLAPCCILAVNELLAAMPAVDEHWLRICREMTANAARAGSAACYRTGYELAVREWKITAAGMTHLGGPTYAEQDRRRYPPGGRESWIIPRPGDDLGRQHD